MAESISFENKTEEARSDFKMKILPSILLLKRSAVEIGLQRQLLSDRFVLIIVVFLYI